LTAYEPGVPPEIVRVEVPEPVMLAGLTLALMDGDVGEEMRPTKALKP